MLTDNAKRGLADIFGEEHLDLSTEGRICYSYDATGEEHMPRAVVFPENPTEISRLLRLAATEGFTVVPRGAGSGFSGGSLPLREAVVLSTERMNRIVEIDEDNMVALVEPGVVNGELQDALSEYGLFYPPDPASLKFSTIGGNIAECAGGPSAVKYGVTRDYVTGLEAVLPTGEIVSTGVRTAKGVVGYDLTRLIVGSEGTLAVVTKAWLRLLPLPEETRTLLVAFSSMGDAARATSAILAARVVPAKLEIIDSVCIEAVREHSEVGLPEASAILLVEVDGTPEEVARERESVEEISVENNALSVTGASDKKEARELWKARRAISPSLKKVRPHKLNEDVVVPRTRLPELVSGVEEISARNRVVIACFGHGGDGNVHVNVMVDKEDAGEHERGLSAVKDLFELVLSLGGTISGEHGVGTAKAPYLEMELEGPVIDLMRNIKKVFDPEGILNPDKIFSSEVKK